jgi:hypothetical protein
MQENARADSLEKNADITRGINRECDAPLSLMTFYSPADRITPPSAEPIDEINRKFFLGETVKFVGRYQIGIAKFITTRPPELAEAVFTFRLQEPGSLDIIRLRATDHIDAPAKNSIASFYLVWHAEIFPNVKDYVGQRTAGLINELTELVAHDISQNTLLAIITRITSHQRALR